MLTSRMDALVRWQEAPTQITSFRHNPLIKKPINVALSALSSKTALGIATGAGALLAYAYPTTGTIAATLFSAAAAWTINIAQGDAQARLDKEKEDSLRKEIVDLFGGKESNFIPVQRRRSAPVQPFHENSEGELQFTQAAFPHDRAMVQAQNSKHQTVFGLRLQQKGQIDPSTGINVLSISFSAGKLEIHSSDTPNIQWDMNQLNQLKNGTHPSFQLMAPQGLLATQLRGEVAAQAQSISKLKEELTAQRKTNQDVRKLIEALTNATQANATSFAQLSQRIAHLETILVTKRGPAAPSVPVAFAG